MSHDPKYPIIKIPGDAEVEFKGYGRNVNAKAEGGVTITQFRDKLSAILNSNDTRSQYAGNVFFEIQLRVDYYADKPQELFRKLGVTVRGVLPLRNGGLRKVIVSGSSNTIEKFKNQNIINQEYLKCVEDIRAIDSDAKIGEAVRAIWNSHSELRVEISLLDKPTEEEMRTLTLTAPDVVSQLQFGRSTATASGLISKDAIEQLSRIALVKFIAIPPEWKASNIFRGSSLSESLKIEPNEQLMTLPRVCVIDTGFGRGLQTHCVQCTSTGAMPVDDIDGHGTNVAALCMFGKDELLSANAAVPSIGVISHKISEMSESNTINFFDELISAMEAHKHQTNVFCFSWNCFFYDTVTYEDRMKQLDEYLQANNLLLVNSCGNIDRDDVRHMYPRYPVYIHENNVLSPSESKYTFSVGATHSVAGSDIVLSSFTTTLLPIVILNEIEERMHRLKPDVYAEGGFILPSSNPAGDVDSGIISISPNGRREPVLGTSVAAPQIARAAALLLKRYSINNVETLKSLLFLKSKLFIQKSNDFEHAGRSFCNDSLVLDADDGFYFVFEEETKPRERVEQMKKDKVYGYRWRFPVTKEIEYVEVAVSHSNNNKDEDVRKMSTRIVTALHKPGAKGPLNKNFLDGYGTFGKWSPLVFGKYAYTRNTQEGLWDLYGYVATRGIPSSKLPCIKVRIGAAVKVRIRDEYLNEKDRIYAKILEMLGLEIREHEHVATQLIPSAQTEATAI